MFASKLIKELQKIIEVYGDLEVFRNTEGDYKYETIKKVILDTDDETITID